MIARDRVQLLAYLPARLWHDSATASSYSRIYRLGSGMTARDRVQLLAYLPARLWHDSA